MEGREIQAHLPNPGRLRELLLPGAAVTLVDSSRRGGRSTDFTAVAVERRGRPVMLHTHHTNRAAHWLLDRRLVPGLEEYEVAGREVAHGRSRFDFLLRRGRAELLLEVKSCTLFGRRIAMFPDAVTERGRRHVLELGALAGRGRRAGVLFLIHWPEAEYFLPEYHTDPLFCDALREVRDRILIKPLALTWRRNLTLSPKVREARIPWDVLESEGKDSGSYLLVLHLPRRTVIEAGGLGTLSLRKGYYIYAGSAARNLGRRVERHRRGGTRTHWHIDYLRETARFHAALPVRSAASLECRMAAGVAALAGWSVPGFGSSDCRCPSHLFAMEGDPLRQRAFIDLLMHFRIDRLLEDPVTAGLFPGSPG